MLSHPQSSRPTVSALTCRKASAGLRLALAALLVQPALPAWAEKADRSKPMVVESDGKQAASVDLARKVTVISGNVTISQGTLLIHADRVEVREPETGQYTAVALGLAGQRATFRQKRDRVDEFIEAEADRIEYDGAAELVRCIGAAQLRILRAGEVSDEATAATIVYNQRTDTVVFDGGAPVAAGSAPGKARLVFTPRPAASQPVAGGTGR
jgi:lipopolysaccharide export system protein LptA